MYEQILVAVDGSDHASTATTHAIDLADRYDATLHALYVIETRTAYDNAIIDPEKRRAALQEDGEETVSDVRKRGADIGIDVVTVIEEGVPPEVIREYIDKHGIDLVCLGERGRSDFKTVLLGSTSETVIHEADIPVIVV